MTLSHIPVLLNEVVSAFHSGEHLNILDCTFGGGGHSRALLERYTKSKVYAIDRDLDAVDRAECLRKIFPQRFFFYSMNFAGINDLCLPPLDNVLMDLGLSSYQLDDADRGFSFKYHTPLDMRMDTTNGISAAQFLNTASTEELIHAVRDFGEERNWKSIVRSILDNRGTDKLLYSDLFAGLIHEALSYPEQTKINPATKTFQGIRIAINRELEALLQALPVLFEKLAIGGRLIVISFHSLEDRIVKQFFKKMAGRAVSNTDFEPSQYKKKLANVITNKPIVPQIEEIKRNPRSRSAKLRILERVK